MKDLESGRLSLNLVYTILVLLCPLESYLILSSVLTHKSGNNDSNNLIGWL